MNKPILQRTLIAIGVLALVGTAGAQVYYANELAEQVAMQAAVPRAGVASTQVIQQADPWQAMHAEMMRLQTQMEQMFNGVSGGDAAAVAADQPVVDQFALQDEGDHYVVTANLPGSSQDSISVNLDGRRLRISSRSQGREKQTADNGQLISQERYASNIQQAFTLPGPVEAAGMKTEFHDGILTVTVPKAAS